MTTQIDLFKKCRDKWVALFDCVENCITRSEQLGAAAIVCFLLLLLPLGIFKTSYPPEGFFIIRVALAVIAAAFAAIAVPGFLEVVFKVPKIFVYAGDWRRNKKEGEYPQFARASL